MYTTTISFHNEPVLNFCLLVDAVRTIVLFQKITKPPPDKMVGFKVAEF